jgi:putative redox protein
MVNSTTTSFVGSGGEALSGRLDVPSRTPAAYAVFAHCFTCSKDSHAAARISRALTASNVAVLRFDFTGLGASGGDFADATFTSNVADVVLAAAHLRDMTAAPGLLIGHSLGGAAVLAAAASVPEVMAVVTIGAPSDPSHITHLFAGTSADIDARGEADVSLAGRTFRIRKSFLDDISMQPQRDRIAALHRPLLVMHAPDDDTVGIENAREIFDAARHPKSFVALPGADHLINDERDAAYVAGVIGSWASRFLPAPQPVAIDAPATSVVVTQPDRSRLVREVRSGRHGLTVDEPVEVGGEDLGPAPYELLLAALGVCTSMTMQLYAKRKGWPLEAVTVTLRHGRIHAADCESCETQQGRLDRIERDITIEGDLDDVQRAALLVIADKCPVHRTLTSEVVIETREL